MKSARGRNQSSRSRMSGWDGKEEPMDLGEKLNLTVNE